MNLNIRCNCDFRALVQACQKFPQLLETPPKLEIDCGTFSCSTVDELMDMLKYAANEELKK